MLLRKSRALVSRWVLWVVWLLPGAQLSIPRIGSVLLELGLEVAFPPVGGLSPRASSDDLPAPHPVGEVRFSKKVTFLDSGSGEALKAVDLLGSVLVGLGVDLEALRSQVRSPSSTQLSGVAPTGRLLAQEYNKQTEKMEQLQKKLQAGRGRVSRGTGELEVAQCALAAMEEEEKLLENEVEDLRRRIAEEREGRMGEREGRF